MTPLGSIVPSIRRMWPPVGSGVSAVMLLISSASEFTVIRSHDNDGVVRAAGFFQTIEHLPDAGVHVLDERDELRPFERNAGLAALPGFTLPGDISASKRFYATDIVTDPITINDGHVTVPTATGLGFRIDHTFLDSVTTSTTSLQ